MFKTVNAIKARQSLGELLEEVFYKNDHFLITRKDKAMAVMISVEDYKRFLQQREEDFSTLDELRAVSSKKTPQEDVEQDVAVAIKRARSRK